MSLRINNAIQQIKSIHTQKQNRFIYIKIGAQGMHSVYGTNSRIAAAWHRFKDQIQCCYPSNTTMIGGDIGTRSRQKAMDLLNSETERQVAEIEDCVRTAPDLETVRTHRAAMDTIFPPYLSCEKYLAIQSALEAKEEHFDCFNNIVESIPEAVELSGIATRIEIASSILQDGRRVYDPSSGEINGEITVGSRTLFVERHAKNKMTVLHVQQKLGEGASGTVIQVNDLATRRLGALKYGSNVHLEAANLEQLRKMGIKGVQPPPYLVTSMNKIDILGRRTTVQAVVGKLFTAASDQPDLFAIIKYGKLNPKQQMNYMAQVIGQYWQIRGKVYHRDIKPENFLVDEASGTVTLGDWAGMTVFTSGTGIPRQTLLSLEGTKTPRYTPYDVVEALQSPHQGTRNLAALFHDRFGIGEVLCIIRTGHPAHFLSPIDESPIGFYRDGLDSSTASEQLKEYITRMCSLKSPETIKEFWEQEHELDALLKAIVEKGELPPIPTYL